MSTRFQPSLGNELYSPAGLFSKPKRRRSLSKLFESKPKDELISNNINLRYISGPVSWYGFEFDNKAVYQKNTTVKILESDAQLTKNTYQPKIV
jgi:hypothetical protein